MIAPEGSVAGADLYEGDVEYSASLPPYPHPEQSLPSAYVLAQEAAAAPVVHSRFRKWVSGIVIGTAIVGGGSVRAGMEYADDPLWAAKEMRNVALQESAPAIPDDIRERVNYYLDRPTDPGLEKVLADSQARYAELEFGDDMTVSSQMFANAYKDFVLAQAEVYGVEVIDDRPYAQEITESTSVADITAIMNRFTEQYGIAVGPHTMPDGIDLVSGAHVLDAQTIDTEQFRQGAIDLIGALAYMPTEIAEIADLREIRLVEEIGAVENGVIGDFKPAGIAITSAGVIAIPIEYFYQGSFMLLMHEISHRLDYKTSGGVWGMHHDSEFMALNTPDFQYGDPMIPSLEANVIEPYGASNPAEDKATLYETMLNGLASDIAVGSIHDEKYRMLLGRLEMHKPGVVGYLSAISSYGDPE